ncbi:hypothetical protein FJT64_004896 [Amphibalanus amphitrite]|uniref:Serine/threonine-protein kinase clkA n=1 Tax=Amphibalanus amphitrite TaxID=1232801 RepID=A0A6A4W3X7_AMPAM|nr:hypothetical protein FJT64_004896 [Amphibalanus amphitrite]
MRVHLWLLVVLVPAVAGGFFDRMVARYRERREHRHEERFRPIFVDYQDEMEKLIAENAANMESEHPEFALGVPVNTGTRLTEDNTNTSGGNPAANDGSPDSSTGIKGVHPGRVPAEEDGFSNTPQSVGDGRRNRYILGPSDLRDVEYTHQDGDSFVEDGINARASNCNYFSNVYYKKPTHHHYFYINFNDSSSLYNRYKAYYKPSDKSDKFEAYNDQLKEQSYKKHFDDLSRQFNYCKKSDVIDKRSTNNYYNSSSSNHNKTYNHFDKANNNHNDRANNNNNNSNRANNHNNENNNHNKAKNHNNEPNNHNVNTNNYYDKVNNHDKENDHDRANNDHNERNNHNNKVNNHNAQFSTHHNNRSATNQVRRGDYTSAVTPGTGDDKVRTVYQEEEALHHTDFG